MKHYLKIYKKLLELSWLTLIIHRSTFLSSIISSLVWSFFNIIVIIFLTSKNSNVFGWTRQDLIILVASANVLLGLFYFFFSKNIHEFSEMVNKGKLDSILLKPIDSQFSISLWQASYQSLSRTIFGISIITLILVQMHEAIQIFTIGMFLLFLVCGVLLQYSIWFIVVTLTIWLTNLSNLNDLLYNTNDLARFPPEMYRAGKELLYFFVFPFTLIVVVPAKILLAKATISDIFALIAVLAIFLFISRKFFHFALRYYTSAS